MIKNRPSTKVKQYCYHQSLGNTKSLYLHTNDSEVTSSDRWNNTSPTSTVYTVGTMQEQMRSSNAMIAYCLPDKPAFVKKYIHSKQFK